MSRQAVRVQAAVRSQTMARNAAQDGAIGAALGLLLVSGLIAGSLDMQGMMASSQQPLASLASMVSVVVVECAIVAGLGGALIRKLALGE